ncbi:signal peptidase I [Clostridium sp. Ade.TY]|uniref:signal peptidase I n=1 Tax=Clostridium sp. Ade.TY TaxID=1391647 RepID=UPI00041498B9|nr:signal peptidase I [Clostridium sp. Ade.TY]
MGKRFIRDIVWPIILAIIIALLINKFLIFKVEVPTSSMEPTIKIGEKFLVTKVYNFNNLKRGDIIVFKNEEKNQLMIKRLIGLPGDSIDIRGDELYINGEFVKEDYVKNPDGYFGEFKVPENKYFFLGDNRKNSADSREWDNPYIPKEDIKGEAQLRIYPIKEFGSVK